MSRLMELLAGVEAGLKAPSPALFRDVRVQIDPVDLEDIAKQSFRTPAARVVFAEGRSIRNPDRSLNLDCGLAVAVMARREGDRPADVIVADLLIAAAGLVDNNRWGLTRIGFPRDLVFRVVVEPGVENKGLSIGLLVFRQRLVRVTPGLDAARGLVADDGTAMRSDEVLPPEHLRDELDGGGP